MKLYEILEVRDLITKLNKIKFNDFKTTLEVYKLSKKIEDSFNVANQEQQKIIDMYVLKDENGQLVIKDSQYQFENEDKKKKFIDDMNNLTVSDIEDINKIDINVNKIQFAEDLTSEEMLRLETIINWIY